MRNQRGFNRGPRGKFVPASELNQTRMTALSNAPRSPAPDPGMDEGWDGWNAEWNADNLHDQETDMEPRRKATRTSLSVAPEPRTCLLKVGRSFLGHDDPVTVFGCPREAFDDVMSGVSLADHLSQKCQAMLQVMVPTSLAVPVNGRCKEQTMVVGMLEQTMHQVLARLEAAAKSSRDAAATANALRKAALNKVGQAELAVVRAQEFLDGRKTVMVKSQQALEASKRALLEKQEEQQEYSTAGDDEKMALKSLEGTLALEYRALLEGRWETRDDLRSLLKAVSPMWSRLSLEDSMKAALPRAFSKKPSERGPFDRMFIEQTSERLQTKASEMRKRIHMSASGEVERDIEALERKIEVATKAQAAAAYTVTQAQASHRSALANLKAAQASMEVVGPEHATKTEVAGACESQLEQFKVGALQSFKRLRDRRSAEPTAVLESGPPEQVGLAGAGDDGIN